jgi:hypothetical protein
VSASSVKLIVVSSRISVIVYGVSVPSLHTLMKLKMHFRFHITFHSLNKTIAKSENTANACRIIMA